MPQHGVHRHSCPQKVACGCHRRLRRVTGAHEACQLPHWMRVKMWRAGHPTCTPPPTHFTAINSCLELTPKPPSPVVLSAGLQNVFSAGHKHPDNTPALPQHHFGWMAPDRGSVPQAVSAACRHVQYTQIAVHAMCSTHIASHCICM